MEKIKIWLEKYFKEIIFSFSIIIILLTFISYCFNHSFGIGNNYELNTDKLGSFGDFVGGFLGTILTIIATIYIYQTFNAQKKSIEIQEDQLKNQKKELKSQKSELILQKQLIAQQQFESTFFNLLNTHRELKKELVMFKLTQLNIIISGSASSIEKEKLVGVEVLEEVNNHFKNYFYKITKRKINFTEIYNDNKFSIRDFKLEEDIKEYNKKIENDNSEKNILTFIYKKIFDKFQDEISHYCRNVYHILKFIRENEENEQNLNNKLSFRKYADIFQSQLNVNEQFLLFYNFIHFNENDNEEYLHPMNIVNHYKFLENLGSNNLLDKELHNNKNFYTFDIK